jgi:hypothetical protein
MYSQYRREDFDCEEKARDWQRMGKKTDSSFICISNGGPKRRRQKDNELVRALIREASELRLHKPLTKRHTNRVLQFPSTFLSIFTSSQATNSKTVA